MGKLSGHVMWKKRSMNSEMHNTENEKLKYN
jgi:hypothetical protein